MDCFDQLSELCEKYKKTHDIIIGGDFNENISIENKSKRACVMNKFMEEYDLTTTSNGPLFINVNGVSVTEIDYVLYSDCNKKQKTVSKLEDIKANVSDQYPLLLQVECCLSIKF